MNDAYVLVGNTNTRKSSLLRSLTGCFNRSVRDIALQGGGSIRLHARVAALQESRTTPEEFVAELARSRCAHAAFSLWPEAHPHDAQRWPDAAAYLQALQEQGWRVAGLAVLGAHPWSPPKALAAGGMVRVTEVLTQPVNLSAHRIRQHFGWI